MQKNTKTILSANIKGFKPIKDEYILYFSVLINILLFLFVICSYVNINTKFDDLSNVINSNYNILNNKIIKNDIIIKDIINGVKPKKAEATIHIKQKNNKIYTFNINGKKIKLTEKELELKLVSYISIYMSKNYSKNNINHITKIAKSYIRLIKIINNNEMLLYYVAICGVESNYQMTVKSNAGAIGIPQVMWKYWGKVAVKNWDTTHNEYVNSVYKQLYIGWKVYDIQLKKAKNNIHLANKFYSGGHKTYTAKINKRYNHLKNILIS